MTGLRGEMRQPPCSVSLFQSAAVDVACSLTTTAVIAFALATFTVAAPVEAAGRSEVGTRAMLPCVPLTRRHERRYGPGGPDGQDSSEDPEDSTTSGDSGGLDEAVKSVDETLSMDACTD